MAPASLQNIPGTYSGAVQDFYRDPSGCALAPLGDLLGQQRFADGFGTVFADIDRLAEVEHQRTGLKEGLPMTRIIDADGHMVEPRPLWSQYAEPEFREQMIQIRRDQTGNDELWINGGNRSRQLLPAASMMPGGPVRSLMRPRSMCSLR